MQEYERAVIFRLGRLLSGGAKGPGMCYIPSSLNLMYHSIRWVWCSLIRNEICVAPVFSHKAAHDILFLPTSAGFDTNVKLKNPFPSLSLSLSLSPRHFLRFAVHWDVHEGGSAYGSFRHPASRGPITLIYFALPPTHTLGYVLCESSWILVTRYTWCPQVLTRDSVTVSVDAVVYYRVSNATVSVANVENGKC